MGEVYQGRDTQLGRDVAVKVLPTTVSTDPDRLRRFEQEACAASALNHPNILIVHDIGAHDGTTYVVSELLEGETLRKRIGGTPLGQRRAVDYALQIANGLAAAHEKGIIHRDLKPDNIMLMPRMGDPEFVKVLDFGLAKMFSEGSAVKTAAGVLLGTPQYMSPEACESKAGIDHRTDIYALGILLFQMMTGRLPFDGESMGEVLIKQVTQLPPPPRETLRPDS